jgi:hypothetical protein
MVISSTVYEIYSKKLNNSHSENTKHRILTSFSIISNTRNLLRGDDRYESLNIMKLFMTIQVVIIHTYLFYWTSLFAKRIFSTGIHNILIDDKYFFMRSAPFFMDSFMVSM